MPKFELFGGASCPYTREMREWLDWNGYEYIEYNIEADDAARTRMIAISGQRSVPVLLEDGQVKQIGWQGRSCLV